MVAMASEVKLDLSMRIVRQGDLAKVAVGDELVQLERLRALIHAINVERAEGRADFLKQQALLAKRSGRKMSGMIIPAPIAIPTPDPQQ
nr:hypothetical protein [uncultured Cohaesibacter sp.]